MSDDTTALDLFVERLTQAQSALYGCVHAMMGGSQDVADVMQETNRALWRKWQQYDPARPFLTWAYRVAQFEVLVYRRRAARDRLIFDEELMGQIAEECARQTPAAGELWALERCLQKLPPEQRSLVEARYARGEMVQDIAQRVGKAANAVSALLYRIRGLLADCVARTLAMEEHA
jgi:RNA polymerase sigma-70 factor (ECF subfamily)